MGAKGHKVRRAGPTAGFADLLRNRGGIETKEHPLHLLSCEAAPERLQDLIELDVRNYAVSVLFAGRARGQGRANAVTAIHVRTR